MDTDVVYGESVYLIFGHFISAKTLIALDNGIFFKVYRA